MKGWNDIYPASTTKLDTIKDKGKAPCRDQGGPTPGPSSFSTMGASFSEGRKFANIAPKLDSNPPKPAGINPESPANRTGSRRKRARVDEDPQRSSHLVQQTYPMAGPFPDDLQLVGISSIQSLANDIQDNQTLTTTFDPLPGFQNPTQAETPLSLNFPLTHAPHGQVPPTTHQNTPICYPPTPGAQICAGCGARLAALRRNIMAIPDVVIVMQLLQVYFALRDNWHDCHVRGGGVGGLDG